VKRRRDTLHFAQGSKQSSSCGDDKPRKSDSASRLGAFDRAALLEPRSFSIQSLFVRSGTGYSLIEMR
jgi:hypothetical protein